MTISKIKCDNICQITGENLLKQRNYKRNRFKFMKKGKKTKMMILYAQLVRNFGKILFKQM